MHDSCRMKTGRWKNMPDFIKLHRCITSYKFQRSMNLCPYHYQIILLYYSLLIKKKKKSSRRACLSLQRSFNKIKGKVTAMSVFCIYQGYSGQKKKRKKESKNLSDLIFHSDLIKVLHKMLKVTVTLHKYNKIEDFL